MKEIIQTTDLSKHYGDVKAVESLNLTVNKGEIYGFLGLNGAGKTTTIRMLLGMINPTRGKAYINNKVVKPNQSTLWNDIGYLVEIPYSYPNLTVRENLDIIRRLRKISDRGAVDRIIDLLEISPYANRKAKNLSLGNKQRLGLAKAMIHKPKILILDEPTNGFDPAGIYEVREMLSNLAKSEGVTIFISSHILGEISRFATRIGIIHNGLLIQEITKQELDDLANKRLTIQCHDQAKALDVLQKNDFVQLKNTNNIIELGDQRAMDHPERIAQLLVEAQCPPSLLKVEEEDLESYFLRTIKSKNATS